MSHVAWLGGRFQAAPSTQAILADHVAELVALNSDWLHDDPPTAAVADFERDDVTFRIPIIVPEAGDSADEHRARVAFTLRGLYAFLAANYAMSAPPHCAASGLVQPRSFAAVWDDIEGLAVADAPEHVSDVAGTATGLDDELGEMAWLHADATPDMRQLAAAEFAAAHKAVTNVLVEPARAIPVFVSSAAANVRKVLTAKEAF